MTKHYLKSGYDRTVLKLVEEALARYPYIKTDIERLRKDIIDARPDPTTEGRGATPGDPTLLKTVRLSTHDGLDNLERWAQSIERVYRKLDCEQQKLVRMRYWGRRRSVYEICKALHLSRSTYYRYRIAILKAIAIERGLLLP